MTVELIPQQPLTTVGRDMPGRMIVGGSSGARNQVVVMEWELTCSEWSDSHPFDEINYVLQGELHVEADGTLVVAKVGDTVRVLAGSIGRYFAPDHARMLAIYAPNPEGLNSMSFGHRPLPQRS
jgi:ethanolamine utilization protein EutQ (cupin superfamily)